MAKKTYYEKLKDPRWQKKRLEILERDRFKCKVCGCADQELHVHHGYYEKNLEPWEYDESTLHTLCLECHKQIQVTINEINKYIGSIRPCEIIRHGDDISYGRFENWLYGYDLFYSVAAKHVNEFCEFANKFIDTEDIDDNHCLLNSYIVSEDISL